MGEKPPDQKTGPLTKDYEPQFGIFHDLMKFRVREILLVSSYYDAFVLEEDGRLSEKIFGEYVDLNLRFVPRIHRVSSAEDALKELRKGSYDLVITMTRISDMDVMEFGKKVKQVKPRTPVILLTYEWLEPDLFIRLTRSRGIDKVFYWTGDTRIWLAIIKYVEDLRNVDNDIKRGVRVILLCEDSPKFYSMFLPGVYTEIMTQTRLLISEGVNDLHRLLRMRARPKILMAETYEEGLKLYRKYRHNLLGIISDIEFPRKGEKDDQAGFRFSRKVRKEIPDLPILLQSAQPENRAVALKEGLDFLNKNSGNLLRELSRFILLNFGFGDFIFRYPDGREIGRASNLHEFEKMIQLVPDDSLKYHASRNHISIWLRARTEFEMAETMRPKQVSDFKSIDDLRLFIRQSISRLIAQNQSGVITDFRRADFDLKNSFVRLGNGSLGGKARGLAFLNSLLANTSLDRSFPGVEIKTPHTFVLCSEVFEDFMKDNDLHRHAVAATDNQTMANHFAAGTLRPAVVNDLRTLVTHIHYPIAVRSSSLLEDSQTLPFAGLYSTYMLANNHADLEVRLQQLCQAIKMVFASVYYRSPKEYVRNTSFRIEEERMAVIIQQIVGGEYGDYFYPVVSGVAQSFNFYPVAGMIPQEGIVQLALGLGVTIVEGGQTFKVSPGRPQMNQLFSSPVEWVKQSQNYFYALDLARKSDHIPLDEKFNLAERDLSQAESDGTLFFVGSTFSPQENAIRDTLSIQGPRLVTFAPILKHDIFPLADILKEILAIGKASFGCHVEIEFAVNLFREDDRKPEFYLLQIRPLVVGQETVDIRWNDIENKRVICRSHHAMGNGLYSDCRDLVFIDPETFDISESRAIADQVEEINRFLSEQNRNYVLMGFGRWGTADSWLGIPVEWFQIAGAKIIVESNLGDFRVEPSQGSHFFHNMISLRMGYLHINPDRNQDFIDWPWLTEQPVFKRTTHVVHLRFDEPLITRINGRDSSGLVFKPGES